ncbi:MAG: peptidoglycan-binding protein [Faecousia sp.]
MVTVLPYIPRTITVHLGAPDAYAANVSVPFSDYVKNVASSEIYPTWDESALTANILAIISFALNRVYTEFYRSRGYDFDITSSTAIDQKFINGRSYFDSVSTIVDNIFDNYLRRMGFVEPLAAKFCNGTTVTCEGLSQWGSQSLAQQGLNSMQILRRYYGNNIELVRNAPVRGYTPSYPGTPLRLGSRGPQVTQAQVMLNRISQNYPAIARIYPVDGIFGEQTERSVISFQRIFNLTPDGIIGKATWYQLVRLYVGVNDLAELESQGQTFYRVNWQGSETLQEGNTGQSVRQLQYMLRVVSDYIDTVPSVAIDGIFGPATQAAVIAYQRHAGLTPDGIVGTNTWHSLYNQVSGILSSEETAGLQYPGQPLRLGSSDY